MPRVILALASIALTIFSLADCIQTEDDRVRGIPKWAWIVLIVLIPWVGPITWLLIGKNRSEDAPAQWRRGPSGESSGSGAGSRPRPRREGPMAPDDDPDFLRRLDEDIRRERREKDRRARGDEDPEQPGTEQPGPQEPGPEDGKPA